MAETSVRTDLLQALEVVTQFRVDGVGDELRVLAVDDVLLPVQEPRRDLELRRVLDDRHDALQLVRVELASALVEVNVRLLADDVRVPPADTLDLREGVHDLALAVHVGVQQTQNVLEGNIGIRSDERHDERISVV